MTSESPRAVKLTKAQERLQNALEFLSSWSDGFRAVAPLGKEDEYAAVWWRPREPIYCWATVYGDFQPATLKAGTERGLIERRAEDKHQYRITPAGRALLQEASSND